MFLDAGRVPRTPLRETIRRPARLLLDLKQERPTFMSLMMTNARFGRAAVLAGFLALALAACDKGPDRAAVAAQLKSEVEAELKSIEQGAGPNVVAHSGVTVTPGEDDRYLVAVEGLKFTPDADGYLDVGTVSYLVKPTDDKTYEISDLKIAPSIPFKGNDGKEKGKLALTVKSFAGQWARDLSAFRKLEAEFADIAATDDQGADVRLAGFKMTGELVDKGGGAFDSIGKGTLTGLAAKETGGAGMFGIGEVAFEGRYEAIKVVEFQAAMKKYQELMVGHMAAVEAATKSGTPAPAMTAEQQKTLTDSVAAMAAAIKGGQFKVDLKQMAYTDGGATPFALEQLSLGTAFDGINQDKAGFGLDVSHQGLVLNAPEASTPLAKAVLPKQGNFGIKITELPSKDLTKVLADNLPGMFSADAAMAEANAMAMLVALQAVLQTSGAKVEVTPSAVTAEATEVKADGAFSVMPQSVMGAVGTLNVAWTGLDEVMALAQANPADPSAQDVIGVVSMLMQFAQRETGADGKPVDKFKIDVKETGELLVNDRPM